MDLSPNQFDAGQFPEATRKDGWSPELKARFLTLLAEAGNVRLSARRCAMSAQSAYVQRRRDALFARGWDAAIVLALGHAEQVLADRAIDGIEEEIWYRGELVGTRRRYDSRLLLAHLARLDRQADMADAASDAGRFDEIVALVAGAEVPETLEVNADGLPPSRRDHAESAVRDAERDAADVLGDEASREDPDAYDAIVLTAGDEAHAAADADWAGWFDIACDTVDRIVADLPAEDRVNPSTSVFEIRRPAPVTDVVEWRWPTGDGVNASTSAAAALPARAASAHRPAARWQWPRSPGS